MPAVFATLIAAIFIGSAFTSVAEPTTQSSPDPTSATPDGDLTRFSLEDLMSMEIYSVSKHSQKAADAPAAITAIGQDDIRRSGLTSIPELLRLAPGMDVGRINASQWAITSRGFNDLFGNKLLVLMDGRSVYTPVFSGVYWETQDYLLEDLDRIEVIRGPGATLWGANAVNGVINISTKSARDTQGFLFTGNGSNVEQIGGVRYGGKLDDLTYYRVYAKYRTTDNFDLANGRDAHDGWDALRGGFRIDRYATDRDTFTLEGDFYDNRIGQTVNLPVLFPPASVPTVRTLTEDGGDLLGRWKHVISDTSDFSLQLYYDRFHRPDLQLNYTFNTFDIDFQHRFALTDRQEIIWGAGYRYLTDSSQATPFVSLSPADRDTHVASGFVQDDVALVPNRFHVILGSKFEHNSFTGFEFQPSGRVLWTPNETNSVWAGISRAVRTPSRWEEDAQFRIATFPTPLGLPGADDILARGDFKSEELLAYEIGYRVRPVSTLSIDATAYYNRYDHLRSVRNGTPAPAGSPPPPHVELPTRLRNSMAGDAFGAELAANWKVTPAWRLSASYTWLDLQLHRGHGDLNTLEQGFEGSSPRNQFQIHSYYDLTKNLELNGSLYYVDSLKALNIPAYFRTDVNLTWRPKLGLELTVGVQNLFDNNRPEWNNGLIHEQSTETPRAVYGQLTYRF